MKKKVLVIGHGGREHAIAWKLSQSLDVEHVFVAPGNPGMIDWRITQVDVPVKPPNFLEIIKFCKDNDIYFTIVGPEAELAAGIVDKFEKEKLRIFGPNKYCAQLESSKEFCKKKMMEFDIPTAKYEVFEYAPIAFAYLEKQFYPLVIKADGLASGKGVYIVQNLDEAHKATIKILEDNIFNMFKPKMIVEEFLDGHEFSQLAFVNGTQIEFMQIAQDYKKSHDNDEGLNTGGMGAYTPVNQFTQKQIEEGHEIIRKMINELKKSGHPFKGVLYAGFMATRSGIKVLEFNVRFGDPETEVLLKAMENDLFDVIDKFIDKKPVELKWNKQYHVGVVLASKGYPDEYRVHKLLPEKDPNNHNIFYMSVTKIDNKLSSNGGRVLIGLGAGDTKDEARIKAYREIDTLLNDDFYCRNDIGK